ncbi:MAG: hypothetical protein GX640_04215 [Fibrobacter sp.]|nr:hypothetical protein [Fibrobacter sp.]
MLDFVNDLTEGISTESYLDRNPEEKTRINMIKLSEYAETRNLSLPEHISDRFRKGFESNELSYKKATALIDKLAEYTSSRGYSWHYEDSHKENMPISIYSSDTEKLKAFIKESHDESKEPFYTAVLFENGKETQLAESREYTDCQNSIGKYFFQISLEEFSRKRQEQQVVKELVEYAEKQKINVPENSRQRMEELVKNGKKTEDVKNYIDAYSNVIIGSGMRIPDKTSSRNKEKTMDIG